MQKQHLPTGSTFLQGKCSLLVLSTLQLGGKTGQRESCGSWQGAGGARGISEGFTSSRIARADTGLLYFQPGKQPLASLQLYQQ